MKAISKCISSRRKRPMPNRMINNRVNRIKDRVRIIPMGRSLVSCSTNQRLRTNTGQRKRRKFLLVMMIMEVEMSSRSLMHLLLSSKFWRGVITRQLGQARLSPPRIIKNYIFDDKTVFNTLYFIFECQSIKPIDIIFLQVNQI